MIAQAPSENNAQPVAVRVLSTGGNQVQLALQEPNHLDGFHPVETVTLMVIEAGAHVLADGTRIEAGTLQSNRLSTAGFEEVSFDSAFDDAPVVLSQVQTRNGGDFVVTRQRNTEADGFEITMQEEERLNSGGHVGETLGWLAIDDGAGVWSGLAFEAGVSGRTVATTATTVAFDSALPEDPVALTGLTSYFGPDPAMTRLLDIDRSGLSARVQEDTSQDAETAHTLESLSYLAIAGEGLLTAPLGDTPPPPGPSDGTIGQVGVIEVDSRGVTIDLLASFSDPVVFASVISENEADPVVVRIDSIRSDQITLRLQEPDALGSHGSEEVSFLVIERGVHQLLDGTLVEAGLTGISGTTANGGFVDVTFADGAFADPAVLTQVQTINGPSFVDTRQRATEGGVQIALEEEEANNLSGHNREQVGYLAIEKTVGMLDLSGEALMFEALSTGDVVTGRPTQVGFEVEFEFDDVPFVLHSLSSFDGGDPGSLRASDIAPDGLSLRFQEDTTRDAEVNHVSETADYLAFAAEGLIFGDTIA